MPFLCLVSPCVRSSGGGGAGAGGAGAAGGAAVGGAPDPTSTDVPGNAGKSSDDIVNSDCSDVGCFTIPTGILTLEL